MIMQLHAGTASSRSCGHLCGSSKALGSVRLHLAALTPATSAVWPVLQAGAGHGWPGAHCHRQAQPQHCHGAHKAWKLCWIKLDGSTGGWGQVRCQACVAP